MSEQNVIVSPLAAVIDTIYEESEQATLERIVSALGQAFACDKNGRATSFHPQLVPLYFSRTRRVLFDETSRRFYNYNPLNGAWYAVTEGAVQQDVLTATREVGDMLGTPNIAVKECSLSKAIQATTYLSSIAARRFDAADPNLIHCANGMLNVATLELSDFSPSFLSRNASPLVWDPTAECPRFLGNLLGSAVSQDDIFLLQQYLGACLLRRNLTQKILLITGTPGGGKTQLVTVLEGLVGQQNSTQLRTDFLGERFEIARMIGKTLLVGRDVPSNFLQCKGAHVLKALSGGDTLTTEAKGRMETHDVSGEFFVVCTSNSRLRVKLEGDVGAWRRRLLLVNYERPKTENPIADFGRVLLAEEGSGILRWAALGAQRVVANGHHISVSEEQQARVDTLLEESDSLGQFVRKCVRRSPGRSLLVSELVEAYGEFCDQMGWSPLPTRIVENSLNDLMMEHHRVVRRNDVRDMLGKAKRGFVGVEFVIE